MAKYTGGTMVKGGYYWNPRSWEVEVIPTEGGRLPAEGAKYVKVPFPMLFVIVPVLGALFLMFLPLIGFALLAHAIVKKVTGGAKEAATDLAATMSPGWRPGEAHMTGKPGEEKAGEGKPSAAVEKLEKEIAEKRGDRK
ncbi:hypothetical protein [Anaeromyxobacter oryzae]|uniref:DUF4342 domain-containing protein n=1 Tax=Anaeromyxobacter oryzae TaxID=2918170 RepID=A0ABM7X4X8_9BACT|nr:hypothetical protein [Anaeromyxobacter oryzae]BDG06862.1 hypothetical protein AMOR_58580 [Anaeromyxobacter oryzae]